MLELEFKSNHSIKSKCLNWIVKKILPTIKDMEKYTIKNKTDKSWGKNLKNVLFRMQRLHSQL